MFDIQAMIHNQDHQAQSLLSEYVNTPFAKVLQILGFDVNFIKGQGQYLWDDQQQRYIDCLGGYGAFGLGRNHPKIKQAIIDYLQTDAPNLLKMGVPKFSGLLAQKLCNLAPGKMERVFFANSGAEAVDTAIKLARAATGRERIVYCKKGFHGLTLGALSCNGGTEFRQGFGQLMQPTTMIPFNDLDALEQELKAKDVAAFIVEPIQGKGVNVPSDDYLHTAAELCHWYNTLLIADEVQTGLGRTGKMFAVNHWSVEPDIICIAKILSGGMIPIGATISSEAIFKKTFSSLDRCVVHSTTFGQNDLAMIAGLTTLDILTEDHLLQHAAEIGEQLKTGLNQLVDRYEMVKAIRGKGLMIGIEFGAPRSLKLAAGWKLIHSVDQSLFAQAIVMPLMSDHHILTQVAGHNMDVIKLLPPLTLNQEDVEQLIKAFDTVIANCHKFPGPMWEVAKRMSKSAFKKKPKIQTNSS